MTQPPGENGPSWRTKEYWSTSYFTGEKIADHFIEMAAYLAMQAEWQHEHTRKVDLEHDCDRLRARCERLEKALKVARLNLEENCAADDLWEINADIDLALEGDKP